MIKMRLLLLVLCGVFISTNVSAQDLPDAPVPQRLVNDLAGILSQREVEALERKLVAFDDSTSSQIVILTVQSLGGYDHSDFAFRVANKWGIGSGEKNNGILILAAMNERKTFIATGYGVEASIPDVYAHRVVNQTIIPNFKNGNYYQAFDEATTRLMGFISGEFDADEEMGRRGAPVGIVFMMFFIILILVIFIARKGGGGNRGGGHWAGTTLGNPHYGGSSWGNFSSGSGSFGGGGFGGFGGGSFGGGGAGGSW